MKKTIHNPASLALIFSLSVLAPAASAQFGGFPQESVDLRFPNSVSLPAADATTESIVSVAQTFLALLSDEQRAAAVYTFDDNQQRSRWSNLPVGLIDRGGLFRGDMSPQQLAALDILLATVLSDAGMRNAELQVAADDTLPDNSGRLKFGKDFYYIAFLGEPRADAPWALQYGGHHLAINTTFAGPRASFSPMLTGGQPITFEYEGVQVDITEQETTAAQVFLDSLDQAQRAQAVRSDEAIQLLLGPGEHGTMIAPEGLRGADLTGPQRELLLAVIEARIGHFNARDTSRKMAAVRAALDDTYFGWWGPQNERGAAYFRISGPEIVLEYAPQEMGGDPTEHIHSMYRDPTNDYAAGWLGAQD